MDENLPDANTVAELADGRADPDAVTDPGTRCEALLVSLARPRNRAEADLALNPADAYSLKLRMQELLREELQRGDLSQN